MRTCCHEKTQGMARSDSIPRRRSRRHDPGRLRDTTRGSTLARLAVAIPRPSSRARSQASRTGRTRGNLARRIRGSGRTRAPSRPARPSRTGRGRRPRRRSRRARVWRRSPSRWPRGQVILCDGDVRNSCRDRLALLGHLEATVDGPGAWARMARLVGPPPRPIAPPRPWNSVNSTPLRRATSARRDWPDTASTRPRGSRTPCWNRSTRASLPDGCRGS